MRESSIAASLRLTTWHLNIQVEDFNGGSEEDISGDNQVCMQHLHHPGTGTFCLLSCMFTVSIVSCLSVWLESSPYTVELFGGLIA